ncbi:homeobox protein cut-like [Pollicipes pollicipes]|uniref:homeobox protein cut-like n=1 Tax=Pollicipes pollicipes TaxID=41117 RepID=UPI001884DCED|nr:homeobox protein cut-like [Pollicipes pollicipes]
METRLQEMLRYNMDKYANQSLDTLQLSRRVRELLSINNIGQRMFARYILGLSQGTVSELLSKPKTWEKLTEKGRDSYRKMHAWAVDDAAVCLLKAVIPKRGKEASRPTLQSRPEEAASDERIAHILTEASQAMKNGPAPAAAAEQPPTPEARSPSRQSPLAEARHPFQPLRQLVGPGGSDEMAQEKIARLYRDHLAKMMSQRPDLGPGFPLDQYQRMRSPEELRLAMDLYNQELVRHIQRQPAPNGTVTSASPLQRMASITNSLISSASLPPLPAQPQRPAKAVLPPITQQQFDQYSNINTEQVVKRIKEHLSQYSLSQRLFGESVLGLSQGSVSDLLARPKPWHMLTQKGREPFIRMKMFLEDDSAVHKLVASQYKIAPDKLMRTGCFNGGKRPSFVKLPTKGPELPRSLESPLPPVVSLASFPGLPPAALASRLAGMDPLMKYGLRLPPAPLPMSVYKTAAITPELDTLYITTKIKEVLLANNIGQKLFGEVVLGLSQGSVSELLSKPKPWHLLSIKGREPFIRMKMWLEDSQNIHKLQRIKSARKESNKRRRPRVDPAGEGDSADAYSSMSNSPNSKKSRVLFTDEQKEALLLAFALDPYPNMTAVEFLCQELGLTHRTITNWFHNHRMRMKQQPAGEGAPLTVGGRDAPHFDPLQFRLLLRGRLQELQREKGLPAPLPFGALPGALPGGLPFPYFGLRTSDDEPAGGLDLSMKSDDGERGSDASGLSWVAEQRERQVINGVCVMQTELGTPPRPGELEPELALGAEPEPEPEPEADCR